MILLAVLISLAPLSHARDLKSEASCAVNLDGGDGLSRYARWLLRDGIIGPTIRLEQLRDALRERRDPGPGTSVGGMIQSADHRLVLYDLLRQVSYRLKALRQGYQALSQRCARVSDELRRNQTKILGMIADSRAVLNSLDAIMSESTGLDVNWTRENLRRTRAVVEDFQMLCQENLPPRETGFLSALGRILWP